MKHVPVAGLMVLGLAACGGGGGGGGQEFVLSDGILQLELPTAEERASFTRGLDEAIDDIQAANEEGTAVTPSETLSYSGIWGAGFDDDERDILVSGRVTGSFSNESGLIGLNFTIEEVSDPEVSISGGFSALPMEVTDGLYSGGAAGSLHTSGFGSSGSWDVVADIDGAIIEGSTFGSIEGSASEITEDVDAGFVTFGGLYIADVPVPEV